jgi:hypothetical protein
MPPTSVIAAQLDALQMNDYPDPDSGIKTAFAFTKPYDSAGGLLSHDQVRSWAAAEQWLSFEAFSEQLRSPPYVQLRNFEQWRPVSQMVFPSSRNGARAVQAVEVVYAFKQSPPPTAAAAGGGRGAGGGAVTGGAIHSPSNSKEVAAGSGIVEPIGRITSSERQQQQQQQEEEEEEGEAGTHSQPCEDATSSGVEEGTSSSTGTSSSRGSSSDASAGKQNLVPESTRGLHRGQQRPEQQQQQQQQQQGRSTEGHRGFMQDTGVAGGGDGGEKLRTTTYTFCLERLESGPYKGCWMTVGVRLGNYAL